ncbi:MAG: TonB-dependent receptor plug domain-containing protein, partial [Desulfobacteraceae bacterium]
MNKHLILMCLGIFLMVKPLLAVDSLPDDLTKLSLEALMSIEVTTASRRTEKLSDTTAAVYVITQEDIRRSTATTIPNLLRMVPGMQVANIDANKWAISSRGFNSRFATKLLVLIDGRSVYSPLFSGVFWDAQDVVLEDVERIEIIRGPGATLWGANAVNGVINIITKSSEETQGFLLSSGGGNKEKFFGTIRYGGSTSDRTHYRIYSKYFYRDSQVDSTGKKSDDQWYQWRSGFRIDSNTYYENSFTFQGDIYQGQSGETASYPIAQTQFPFYKKMTENHDNNLFGGNLLGRFRHSVSDLSELVFQAYYDHN